MKKKSLFRSTTMGNFISLFDSCVTSFRTSVSILSSAALLASCTQGDTKNYYSNPTNTTVTSPTGNNSMSGGGGATGDGGGGQGVLCGNATDSKVSNKLWVRDIYETVANHRLQMKEVAGEADNANEVTQEAIKVLVSSIQKYLGPASPNVDFAYEQFWMNFTKQISFLDEDKELFTSQDANSPIALPSECKLVQIAYWDESSGTDEQGTLYVSRPLWEKLDQINKIGLLAHEFFFKQARKAKYKNSDFIRHKIGQLLSKEGIVSNFDLWNPSNSSKFGTLLPASKNGFMFCEGKSDEDPTARVHLYKYEGKDNNQHLVFPYLESKTISSSILQKSHFVVKKSDLAEDQFANLSNLSIYLSDFPKETEDIGIVSSEKFYEWWYDNSGLQNSQATTPNFLKIVEKMSDLTSLEEKTWWNEQILTPISPIKLSLLNPRFNSDVTNERIFKKRDDLIAAINNKLNSKLNECKNLRMPVYKYNSVVAQLHAEVNRALDSGTYPDPKSWYETIKNIEGFVVSDSDLRMEQGRAIGEETYDAEKCAFSLDKEIVLTIPNLLYNLKLNNYTSQEIEKFLKDDVYYQKSNSRNKLQLRPKMILVAEQGEYTINFNLTCHDYSTIFSNYIRRQNAISKNDLKLSPNEKIHFEIRRPSDNEKEETQHLQSLAAYLTNSQTFDQGLTDVIYHDCDTYPSSACEDYRLFAHKLSEQKSMTLERCSALGYRDNDENISCAIIHFEKMDYSFILRYKLGYAYHGGGRNVPNMLLSYIRVIQNK